MADPPDPIYFRLLVIRCQVGDASAFAELIAICQPRLRGFLHKMLPANEHADDIAQEVWLDVFRDLKKLRDTDAFIPWLYRIAHHRAFRVLRKRKIRIEPIDDSVEIAHEPDSSDFTPEDAAAVHAALDQLSPMHREVLLLRFMHEMTYEQIAQVADCDIGTVRSRIHNAKARLREIIQKAKKSS